MTEYQKGFKDGIAKAVAICQFAAEAYDKGAGIAHSLEARDVGRAQAEWCRDEIKRTKTPRR